MSIESEILRIQHNVANTYAAVSDKGGTVPLQPTSANLAAAVASIPTGGDTSYLVRAPIGTIVIWSGTADNIPTGWALCDGQDGRPDLRDKFVLGAGTAHNVGSTGGAEEVTLTVEQMPEHSHGIKVQWTSGANEICVRAGSDATAAKARPLSSREGGSQPHPNMPPYYTLCYIIKVTADETDGVTMEQVNEAIQEALSSITVNGYTLAITFNGDFAGQTYTVTGPAGETYSGTVPESLTTEVGVKEGEATYTVSATAASGTAYSATVTTDAYYGKYSVELIEVTTKIYGASWDGTSTTKWTRTDDAATFVDPVPYVAGASSYGSPFDNLQPWAGMVKSERMGGVMVAIPKFWYKLTQNGAGMAIQIADGPVDGFSVSPAHMDRNDGKGERDVVYIGRYHCATSTYKSTTGVKPQANMTRSAARTAIHNLGPAIWQNDFATRFTLWLLYIVEFADWNTQATIGKGCGNNSATENMGYTDSMPYHTGTTLSSRDTYGLGTQYRNIEGLWDNVLDWCDGCYNDSNGFNIILNPNAFSDAGGGASAGTPSSGWPSAFGVKTAGYKLFIPTAAGGSETTYSCDNWYFGASGPCVYVGGAYSQVGSRGLFFVHCNAASGSSASIGSRLLELP